MSTTKIFAKQEVEKHNKVGDLWVIIDRKVYDLSKFAEHHPGTLLPITISAGAPIKRLTQRTEWVRKKLQYYHIGNVTEPTEGISEENKKCLEDWHSIVSGLKQRGYFETNYYWYMKYACWLVFLYSFVIYGAFFSQSLLGKMSAAVFLGCFWHQMALLGHDLCHNAVTHHRKTDTLIAILTSTFLGIGAQWWKRSHNVHHIATNAMEYDPDIQHLPVIAITEKFFSNIHSYYHGRVLKFDQIGKWMVSHQHLLYYPIMAVSRWNLYAQSWIMLIKTKEKIEFRTLDFACLSMFWIWYFILASQMRTTGEVIAFILLSHAVAGILHVQITLSHFAMPSYIGKPESGEDDGLSFIRTQLEHSLDIDCPWYMDLFHGGLQFQTCHHLLPRLPRHHLREVTYEHLVPFCKKWNLPYNSLTFVEANIAVLTMLQDVANSASKWKHSAH